MPVSVCFACALWFAGGLAAADGAGAGRRHESSLGVSFDLPADWVAVASDSALIERFYPPLCRADATPIAECPVFLVLQRFTLDAPLDAQALSTRRAQQQARTLFPRAAGRHAEHMPAGVWREADYRMGAIEMRLHITTIVDAAHGWELTGWASPARADDHAAAFRASGASMRLRAHD